MTSKIRVGLTVLFVLVVIVVCALPADVLAQCPMCRMSAQSNMENGGSAGRGLNNGILYMLAMPYLIIGTVGYFWWKNRKKGGESEESVS